MYPSFTGESIQLSASPKLSSASITVMTSFLRAIIAAAAAQNYEFWAILQQ
jgi:hypothetical protein